MAIGKSGLGVKIPPKPGTKKTPKRKAKTKLKTKKATAKKQKSFKKSHDPAVQVPPTDPEQVKEFVKSPYEFIQEIPPNVNPKEFASKEYKKISKQNFHIRINFYTINMILGGVFIFLTMTFQLSSLTTLRKYSMNWMFFAFWFVCILDIIGSFCGILSLVPDYTTGGWDLCNWIVNRWNLSKGVDTYRQKRVPTNPKAPAKTKGAPPKIVVQAPTKKGEKVAANKKADPKKADPKKADPKKADPKKADPKKDDPKKAKDSKVPPKKAAKESTKKSLQVPAANHPKAKKESQKKTQKTDEKDEKGPKKESIYEMSKADYKAAHPGWYRNGAYKKCAYCITGIKIRTKKFNGFMASASFIILNISSILNVMCTAFYKFMKKSSAAFKAEDELCSKTPSGQPPTGVCSQFNKIFNFVLTFVWILIFTRMLSMGIIGWHTDPSKLYELRSTTNRPHRAGSTGSIKSTKSSTSAKSSKSAISKQKDSDASSSSSDAWSEESKVEVIIDDEDNYEENLFRELFAKYESQMNTHLTYEEAFREFLEDEEMSARPSSKSVVSDSAVSGQYDVSVALRQFLRQNQDNETQSQARKSMKVVMESHLKSPKTKK